MPEITLQSFRPVTDEMFYKFSGAVTEIFNRQNISGTHVSEIRVERYAVDGEPLSDANDQRSRTQVNVTMGGGRSGELKAKIGGAITEAAVEILKVDIANVQVIIRGVEPEDFIIAGKPFKAKMSSSEPGN